MKNLQKALSLLIVFVFALNIGLALATDGYVQYDDPQYSFSYPAAWKQGMAKDGSITLRIEGKDEGVMTFAITGDIYSRYIGSDEIDESKILEIIEEGKYGLGKYITFDGSYEIIEYSGLKGFRAFGNVAGVPSSHIVYLWGENTLVIFVFIGESVKAEEDKILSTIKLTGSRMEKGAEGDDYNSWKAEGFGLKYPKGYFSQEHTTGAMFINGANPNDAIAARTYALDVQYSEDLAPSIASANLPKSTKIEANPSMVTVGDWNAALITGDTSAGPLAYYVIGQGRIALALMFIGEEAVSHAETVVSSVAFDK
ncbi:MAG: hypothetical protein GX337_00340 [Christensenellaceae bacterium]|nr:hypothetical protein [Christensenellaceae bacterium]